MSVFSSLEHLDSGTLRSLLPEVRSDIERSYLLELIERADLDEYWSLRATEIEEELGIDFPEAL
jgi:hypothetical protein